MPRVPLLELFANTFCSSSHKLLSVVLLSVLDLSAK